MIWCTIFSCERLLKFLYVSKFDSLKIIKKSERIWIYFEVFAIRIKWFFCKKKWSDRKRKLIPFILVVKAMSWLMIWLVFEICLKKLTLEMIFNRWIFIEMLSIHFLRSHECEPIGKRREIGLKINCPTDKRNLLLNWIAKCGKKTVKKETVYLLNFQTTM